MATITGAPAAANLTGLARRLVTRGLISEIDVRRAQDMATRERISLAAALLEQDLVSTAQLAQTLSEEFGVPLFDPDTLDAAELPLRLIDEGLILRHRVLPLYKRGNRLFVGIKDPTNLRALDEIRFQSNATIEPLLIDAKRLERLIEQALSAAGVSIDEADHGSLDDLNASQFSEADDDGIDATQDDTPIVKFINKVLLDAIKRGASDIHFEPYEAHYRVRFRLDGILRSVASPPVKFTPRISSRLKVMSGLDIAEKRVPQDGRIKLNLSTTRAVDFRVSTCPTLFGEKVVLRLLDASAGKLGIDKLGVEDDQKALFLQAIDKPYGMVVVTGPTGSGKTVSLYAALSILNTEQRNISTVEDPVEIRLAGVNQVQHNQKRGMTFAAALRSFLRQDPDVIMVGEIRDLETAEIAIKAAQTGHMVLSTLHTNDAPQSISRLMHMGIAPYNITSSITLVVAQRLARRLHDCRKPFEIPRAALLAEGFDAAELETLQIFQAASCANCNEGYKGRTGIYQTMPLTASIAQIVLAGGNAIQIAEAARADGIRNLRESALLKVRCGITSLAEINRVTKD